MADDTQRKYRLDLTEAELGCLGALLREEIENINDDPDIRRTFKRGINSLARYIESQYPTQPREGDK